jgi:ribosomal protein S18 acetylase RimI-like enzyme
LIVARRGDATLRHASDKDLDAIDALTVACYRPIQESFVAMLGADCHASVRPDPELSWEERKVGQSRRLFAEHPDQVWVLDRSGEVFGFVTFWLFPERSYGHIDNNGVDTRFAGQGWATFMYRHLLQHFRELGLRFAHVDTGLDPAHEPARRAYAAVGFDRSAPSVDYWQDLGANNVGSHPD